MFIHFTLDSFIESPIEHGGGSTDLRPNWLGERISSGRTSGKLHTFTFLHRGLMRETGSVDHLRTREREEEAIARRRVRFLGRRK
jgi:hypothetical protein